MVRCVEESHQRTTKLIRPIGQLDPEHRAAGREALGASGTGIGIRLLDISSCASCSKERPATSDSKCSLEDPSSTILFAGVAPMSMPLFGDYQRQANGSFDWP